MPVPLQPIKRVTCTYADCAASFDTLEAMRRHKKNAEEHDYCAKCDEDFDSYDDLALHKAFRPDNHGKACRVCGEEFKSTSGLRRHIELNHKVDQKLACVGCGETFYRGSLLIEHLEFGHCKSISAAQFQGHVVHKHLLDKLLHTEGAMADLELKTGYYHAAIDRDEDDGGISLGFLDAESESNVDMPPAIEPEVEPMSPQTVRAMELSQPFPPLPSTTSEGVSGVLSPDFSKMSVADDSQSATGGSTLVTESATTSKRTAKVWKSSETAAAKLFPNAKLTPAPAPALTTVDQVDDYEEKKLGFNIFKMRFWDPTSGDWNPERFKDSVNHYSCPFDCRQRFELPGDLNVHILRDHRITKARCPTCLNSFKSCTALVAHCESRGAKCQISKAENFNTFLDKLTGGFLGVEELTRPDFVHNPTVTYTNCETGRVETYQPPTATYLQYISTKPSDFKEIQHEVAYQIGGGHMPESSYREY